MEGGLFHVRNSAGEDLIYTLNQEQELTCYIASFILYDNISNDTQSKMCGHHTYKLCQYTCIYCKSKFQMDNFINRNNSQILLFKLLFQNFSIS